MTDQTTTIPKGWKISTLGEVAEKIGDGLHGTPEYSDNGEYYFVNGNNIENGKIIIKRETLRVDLKEFEKYKKNLGVNTILLSINGTIGNLAKYRNEKCILGKSAAYLNIKKENSRDFVYYLMLDKKFQRDISKNANGSTIKNVSLAQLRGYSFILPPLPEQRAIAAVLSSLDDKIELLREQTKTLEATAQTIFKEWFVRFNFPNENGEPYATAGGKMIDSILGPIPEGWRVGRLGEFINHIKKNINPSKNPSVVYKHYSLPAFDQNKKPEKSLGKNILSSKYLIDGDCFLVSKLNPKTPRIWTIINPASNSICSTEFQVIQPKNSICFCFVYSVLSSENFTKELASKAKGTSSSHQRANPQDIFDYELLIPNHELLIQHESIILPVLIKMENNNSQIQTLSTLRDTLLPKLMKGEVRVKSEK
jgi:type I restriction enzyme S subunit